MKAILTKGDAYKRLTKLPYGRIFLECRDPFKILTDDFETTNYDTIYEQKFEDAITELIKDGYKLKTITLM